MHSHPVSLHMAEPFLLIMKQKYILLILLILTLIVYSSEINFMPNYKKRPDKWHLLIPMLIFYSLIFIQLIWNVIIMIKNRKMDWMYTVFCFISLFCFANLNNPKGNWQEFGYLGLIAISLILTCLNVFIYTKKNHTTV